MPPEPDVRGFSPDWLNLEWDYLELSPVASDWNMAERLLQTVTRAALAPVGREKFIFEDAGLRNL